MTIITDSVSFEETSFEHATHSMTTKSMSFQMSMCALLAEKIFWADVKYLNSSILLGEKKKKEGNVHKPGAKAVGKVNCGSNLHLSADKKCCLLLGNPSLNFLQLSGQSTTMKLVPSLVCNKNACRWRVQEHNCSNLDFAVTCARFLCPSY